MAEGERIRKQGGPRSAARLAAMQALYQMQIDEDAVLDRVIIEYIEHRLGCEIEGEQYVKADSKLFKDIATGAYGRREEWDPVIEAGLSTGWTLARIDPVLLSILRCGTYELSARPDVPTPVVINEYVDIAHAFYEQSEASFVNGLLDRIARQLRG